MAATRAVGNRLFRQADVFDLDIVGQFFAAEADGVHRKTAIAQLLQRVGSDARSAQARLCFGRHP